MNHENLFLFPNVHIVMKADRICRKQGIKVRVIPVPENISSECGMCLLVATEDVKKCRELFNAEKLVYEVNSEC